MKKIISRRSIFLFSSIAVLILSTTILQSCYPGEELTYSDTDLVATFYNKDANFATKQTFAMPDSIIRIDDDGNPVIDPGPFDQQILNKIKSELQSLGFTQEAPANADVLVIAAVTTSTWASGGCYYSWWYPGWYPPYPGWCYPVYYTYDIGTILIAMLDGDATEAESGLWIAGINGLLGDSNSSTSSRINQNIEQAFNQSPYLGEGK